jgi:hypothetical protein
VNRFQIIAVLGLATLPACSAADDVPGDRPPADAGRDTRTTVRADGQNADRLDASGGGYADEASTPDPDATLPDVPSPPPDAPAPPSDGQPPPPDGAAPPRDGSAPPPDDAPPPPPMDVTSDQAVLSCLVSFTVNGVAWSAPEGGTGDAQSPGRAVRLVGDAANLGSWAPSGGVLLTETSPGNWYGTVTFRDQQLTEFKFVKFEGATPEWENWLPYDSNRSLRVECFGDAGVPRDASDADVTTVSDGPLDRVMDGDGFAASDVAGDMTGTDANDATADGALLDATADAVDAAAPSDERVIPVPARGRTYIGVFGERPPDATK